jgi:hypothetical protein
MAIAMPEIVRKVLKHHDVRRIVGQSSPFGQ